VDALFAALKQARPGEIYIPRAASARITDIAAVLIGDQPVKTIVTGIRPGEKVHEILVSEEEAYRTVERDRYYVIQPVLPELRSGKEPLSSTGKEYSSADDVMGREDVAGLLRAQNLMIADRFVYEEDMLA
jgi:UDP-glucose 4-epimerase